MSILFQDDFSGYPIGASLPFGGWSGNSIGGIISVPGVNPAPTKFLATYPVNFTMVRSTGLEGDQTQVISLFFGMSTITLPGLGVNGQIVQLVNKDPALSNGRALLTFGISGNYGIRLLGPGGLGSAGFYYIPGSPPQAADSNLQTGFTIQDDNWYFIRLDFKSETDPGSGKVTLLAYCYVDGVLVVQGQIPGDETGLIQTNLFNYSPLNVNYIDEFLFFPPILGGGYANITCKINDNTYPVPTLPDDLLFARISQAAVEWIQSPTDGNARISQGVIEWIKAPTNSNARLSQAVIELITTNGIQPASGWQVKEI